MIVRIDNMDIVRAVDKNTMYDTEEECIFHATESIISDFVRDEVRYSVAEEYRKYHT